MQHYAMVNVFLTCVLVISCAPGQQKNLWDNYDYGSITKGTPRDYEADYSLPVGSCVDDAPSCR